MSNAPSKPVSFSRPKVGYFSNRPRRSKIEELLQILPNTEDQQVGAAWEDIKHVICKAADNILGQKPRMVSNGWYDEECKEMLEEQNNERLKMLQRKTRNTEAYKEARRKARKVCRKKKKDYEGKLEEIQAKYKRNKLKQFYEGIRKTRTGFQPRTTMCKNKQGEIVGGERCIGSVGNIL